MIEENEIENVECSNKKKKNLLEVFPFIRIYKIIDVRLQVSMSIYVCMYFQKVFLIKAILTKVL